MYMFCMTIIGDTFPMRWACSMAIRQFSHFPWNSFGTIVDAARAFAICVAMRKLSDVPKIPRL